MAKAVKHVGKLKNGSKVVVAFRTIPGDPHSALIIPTSPLPQTYHDELMGLVDGEQAQQAFELATLLSVRRFSDGGAMLPTLHSQGRMMKVPTTNVTMTPTNKEETHITLDKLNELIAEQKGVSLEELAIQPDSKENVKKTDPAKVSEPTVNETGDVLSDEDLAAQYRAQADTLYKEVQELRKKADELAPKKTAKKPAKVDA